MTCPVIHLKLEKHAKTSPTNKMIKYKGTISVRIVLPQMDTVEKKEQKKDPCCCQMKWIPKKRRPNKDPPT